MSVLLFELTLTRIFSIVLWYNYAFMAISVAFSGLGIGALRVYILKNKIKKSEQKLPSKIFQSTIAFAISVPISLFVIGHIIPSSTSFLYVFYIASSIPFFFAGISMAQIYLTMPREISKLYFVDLAGAAAATLILDPLLQQLGAESVLLLTSLLVIGPPLITALVFFISPDKKKNVLSSSVPVIENKIKLYGIIMLAASCVLLVANVAGSNILAIQPGESKGLRVELTNPSAFKHLSSQWNSFSRIDVTRDIHPQKVLARVRIDADAVTPIFKWNGSSIDIQWVKEYMDYIPYEISKSNNNSNTLVIGGGGGEDILVALAGGTKNITAVELNPLIVSAVKDFGGSLAGNLYQRGDVKLFIDDGRRFISSTNSKYDKIVIKLVDSWAAQLAGGYALSENYLYTVEAFKQYLHHLNGDNGMLVMVRWSFELPRLLPLVVESLRQEEEEAGGGNNIQDISKQILVVEDRPGLYFGSDDKSTVYPVLVIVKNGPFSSSELDLVKSKIAKNNAKVIAMPGVYTQFPYDKLLSVPASQLGSLPFYWNDPLRNCQIYFKCTANSTTGWKDNTSFQLSTISTNNKTWSWIYGKEIDVKPNERYALATHMKLNTFATASHMKIEGYNETSKQWYQIIQCPIGTTNGRPLEWHEYNCEMTISKRTSKIRPVLMAGWSSQQNKEAVTWFDDMNLRNLNNVYSNKTYTTTNNLISNPDFTYYYSDVKQSQQSDNDPTTSLLKMKPPTDDSPFYFAREQIPNQMIILLETILGISIVLALLLIYYSRLNRILLMTSLFRFHILFAIFIGLGFIFLEITFIQKFLLLLGTPIMALTVILFSILLSSGIGAYLSGKLFPKNPYKAVVISIPLLVGILIAYYGFLQGIIDSNIVLPLEQRIALTFALLSPTGVLMGFQFPSITRMASSSSSSTMNASAQRSGDGNITLLWGVNVIASVIGTVLTAISSMVIGFDGNLLIGLGLYLGALVSAIAATKIMYQVGSGKEVVVK